MELHHSKHHQAYVNGYNAAYEKFQEVQHPSAHHVYGSSSMRSALPRYASIEFTRES